MSEAPRAGRIPFRTRAEAEAIVKEFEASGLKRREFCARSGLPLGTLDLYRKRLRRAAASKADNASGTKPRPRWVKVERANSEPVRAAIGIVLGEGLCIDVAPGFDRATLRQVLELLGSE